MPTTQEEKPAKSRARNRKADQRSSKSRQQQVEVRAAEPDPVSPMVAEAEVLEAEVLEAEVAAVDIAPAMAAVDVAPAVAEVDVAPVVAMEKVSEEKVVEAVLSGEVLPPEVRSTASQAAPLQAIAQAYGEYTQKSWLNGRLLVERLIAVRSFDEAIEIQGEFAKQAYTNFLVQSERICVLYGEWAQQFFRPLVWRL